MPLHCMRHPIRPLIGRAPGPDTASSCSVDQTSLLHPWLWSGAQTPARQFSSSACRSELPCGCSASVKQRLPMLSRESLFDASLGATQAKLT